MASQKVPDPKARPMERMRVVLQRVTRAAASVGGRVVGRIDHGLLALVGVAAGDGPADVAYMASKVLEVRVFADTAGRMNRSVRDVGGGVLVVSQFTLMGDARKGRRPAFDAAEAPERARAIYEALIVELTTVRPRRRDGRVSGRHAGRIDQRWTCDRVARQPPLVLAGPSGRK